MLTISFALDREVRASEREEKETKLFMMFTSPWGPAPVCYSRAADLGSSAIMVSVNVNEVVCLIYSN